MDDEPDGNGANGGSNGGHGQASDTGPTGPFTALSSAELAAVTVDDDEDLEDLSGDIEPSEDSVRAPMPVRPSSAATTEAPGGVPSLDEAAADLDWGLEEAATRAATGAERLEPTPHSPTSLGFAAPPLADAFTVQPGTAAPSMSEPYDDGLAFAPTVGIPSTPPAAPPVVSPFALVADVESAHAAPHAPVAPPPPPSPFAPSVTPAPPTFAAPPPAMPVQPWGTPLSGSSGAVQPFQAADALPIIDEPLPVTRPMPERAAPFAPSIAPVEDDFPLPAPRKSSAGTIIGILAGVLIAAVIAAGVWWFQLRDKSGTLVLRAAEDATVTVDGAPAQGVSGLFIVRDLGVGTHTVMVIRPGAAPWANAVQISAGDSLQIEAPGARGGDTGATTSPVASALPPGTLPAVGPAMPAPIPTATAPAVSPATTTPAPAATPATTTPSATPNPTPRAPVTPRTAPGTTPGTTPRTQPTEPAARGGTGFLSVQTTPWAAVEVDGRSVGNTPVRSHELRAGDHRVTLIVQAWNIRQTRRVVIRAGETSTVTIRFQEPGAQAAPPQGGANPMGPRPMGPGPMGPGPAPMGPRPMGPGPMGGPPRN